MIVILFESGFCRVLLNIFWGIFQFSWSIYPLLYSQLHIECRNFEGGSISKCYKAKSFERSLYAIEAGACWELPLSSRKHSQKPISPKEKKRDKKKAEMNKYKNNPVVIASDKWFWKKKQKRNNRNDCKHLRPLSSITGKRTQLLWSGPGKTEVKPVIPFKQWC